MDIVNRQNPKTCVYPRSTIDRAIRAIVCSPLRSHLFIVMSSQSIPLTAIAKENGWEKGYTQRPLSEFTCETTLSWLIDVGVLRREVDGQGITDSYRLTPLGHQVTRELHNMGDWSTPSWSDRLKDAGTRWLRLPF